MFSKSFAVFLSSSLFLHFFCLSPIACGFQTGAPNNGVPNNGFVNNSDGFAASTPVMTFVDPANGQPYGRYVIDETIPVVAYSYQEVKERVFVPTTITENKTTTVTQYFPIQSHQLQLRNVPNWNPFASPQQVWQYVPIVQYQPNYVQVTQPVTYQKFEEREVSRMIPVFGSQSKQVHRFADRPLGQSPGGGNTIASNIAANNASNTIVIPAVPLRPNMQPNPNAMASYNGYGGYGANGNQNYGVAPNPAYPYAITASQPLSRWTSFASGTGSLFSGSLFNNNRNTNYVASNTPVGQPYVWGNNNQSSMSFRPNTSPYVTPQQSWGMPPGNSYRDPMQGGMPTTVLR